MLLCVAGDPTSSSDCPLLDSSTANPHPFKLLRRGYEKETVFPESLPNLFHTVLVFSRSLCEVTISKMGQLRHAEARHHAPNHEVEAELSLEAQFHASLTILSCP